MPAVVVAESELRGGADHPVGDVSVGLAGGDGEAAGQHRPGQRDDDEVADGEVVRTADDPSRRRHSSLCSPTSTWHQRMDLPLSCSSTSYASTRPMTSGPVTSAPACLDGLDLETGPDQRLGQVAARQIVGQGRVLAQPAQRRPHRATPTQGAAEPDVAFDHVAHVLGVVAEHQGAVDPHPEREAGVDVGVDPAGLQHPRVDHPAAAPLDPALALAGPAGSVGVADRVAVADEALQVHLGRRLGEREVVGPHPGPGRRRTWPARSGRGCRADAPRVMPLSTHQTFDLVEHRQVGGVVLVGAVHPARDRPRRSAARASAARGSAPARCGCAAPARRPAGSTNKVSCMVRAGMVGDEVERVEVDPLRLELGPLGHLPAHGDEDVLHQVHQGGDRVHRADRAPGSTGSVTSTRSSTSARVSSAALISASRACRAWLIWPGPGRSATPASLRACGGSAPISRLARAIGDRSPAWASRACLSSADGGRRGEGGQRLGDHRLDAARRSTA